MDITYVKAGLSGSYRVWAWPQSGPVALGAVSRNLFGSGWRAFPESSVKPPVRPFRTRKLAAEWLVAASGLWLVKP